MTLVDRFILKNKNCLIPTFHLCYVGGFVKASDKFLLTGEKIAIVE